MGTQLSTVLGLGKEYILIYTYELLRTKNSFELNFLVSQEMILKNFFPNILI